jgi:hypothetical protein
MLRQSGADRRGSDDRVTRSGAIAHADDPRCGCVFDCSHWCMIERKDEWGMVLSYLLRAPVALSDSDDEPDQGPDRGTATGSQPSDRRRARRVRAAGSRVPPGW